MAAPATSPPVADAIPKGCFAGLYTFNWTALSVRTALICSLAIAPCLVVDVLVGHPSAGLIAGGRAMTAGLGINQRIADSRLWPMIAAVIPIDALVRHRGRATMQNQA